MAKNIVHVARNTLAFYHGGQLFNFIFTLLLCHTMAQFCLLGAAKKTDCQHYRYTHY